MFNGIGNFLKGIDFKNLDIEEIVSKLINVVPDGQGKKAMDLAMGIAKKGGNVKDVKNALENMIPGAKEKLAANQIWNNIPEEKDALVNYGKNIAKQFQIIK